MTVCYPKEILVLRIRTTDDHITISGLVESTWNKWDWIDDVMFITLHIEECPRFPDDWLGGDRINATTLQYNFNHSWTQKFRREVTLHLKEYLIKVFEHDYDLFFK